MGHNGQILGLYWIIFKPLSRLFAQITEKLLFFPLKHFAYFVYVYVLVNFDVFTSSNNVKGDPANSIMY